MAGRESRRVADIPRRIARDRDPMRLGGRPETVVAARIDPRTRLTVRLARTVDQPAAGSLAVRTRDRRGRRSPDQRRDRRRSRSRAAGRPDRRRRRDRQVHRGGHESRARLDRRHHLDRPRGGSRRPAGRTARPTAPGLRGAGGVRRHRPVGQPRAASCWRRQR